MAPRAICLNSDSGVFSRKPMILIVEDDLVIAHFIRDGLLEAGFAVEIASTGTSALEMLQAPSSYELVILDLMLPEIDGMTVLNSIRKMENHIPVIILSAKHTVDDRVYGLKNGADDYLVKPFSFPELLIRVQNLLKRLPLSEALNRMSCGDLHVDTIKREVRRGNQRIELQTKEFTLLTLLLQHQGEVLSKHLILKEVWGYTFDPQTNVVDVLVCRLRNKIDKESKIKLIHTIRGLGYVCKAN